MTDDKGAGEGPYYHILASNKEWCVFACPKCAYDKGRKSVEKDFKELLELANRFRHSSRYSGGLKWVIDFEQEFDAWKKARGIE